MASTPERLIAEAEKKCAPLTGFSRFFGGDSSYRYEEAADLFVKAANLYRIEKKYVNAGKVFEQASAALDKAGNSHECATSLYEAFKCYKEDSPQDAARVLKRAIEIYAQNGNFRRAAGLKMDLAGIYEENLNDLPEAVKHYEQAGEWYGADQAQALASKAYVKAADLALLLGQYIHAAELYESVAKKSLGNSLSQWSLKEYFFKCTLCYMAAEDLVAAKRGLDQFLEMDGSFRTTREYKLLTDLLDAVDARDADVFSDKLFEYDQYSKLDKWRTTILLKIKDLIVEADDDIL